MRETARAVQRTAEDINVNVGMMLRKRSKGNASVSIIHMFLNTEFKT